MNVLVTGGAGFIGTHLVRRLLHEGCDVAVLDNFSSQVHGDAQELPANLAGEVELFRGDVRNEDVLRRAVEERDVIVHLAAETGTGQSMYEVRRYQDANVGGTAAILDLLVNWPNSRVSKVVVASSRAIYGKGNTGAASMGSSIRADADRRIWRPANTSRAVPSAGIGAPRRPLVKILRRTLFRCTD